MRVERVRAPRIARPAYYARTGTPARDLLAVLHPPYTVWHLSYVALGAAIAPEVDALRLAGALAAFFLGTGVAAHALDEWHGRPLGTALPGGVLLTLAVGGFAGAGLIAVLGAFVISPWLLAWAAAGVLLAAGYALEWDARLHSDGGFALAWGAFPVLAGYWAQAERLDVAVLALALAAAVLSLAQRALSTPARRVRRRTDDASVALLADGLEERWDAERLLATWERPLRCLAAAMPLLAAALLLARL